MRPVPSRARDMFRTEHTMGVDWTCAVILFRTEHVTGSEVMNVCYSINIFLRRSPCQLHQGWRVDLLPPKDVEQGLATGEGAAAGAGFGRPRPGRRVTRRG